MRHDRELLAAALRERELRFHRKAQAKSGGLIAFVRYFWHILEPGRTLVDGWALESICEHLEAVSRGEIKRLLINVPPGFMKSLLTDVFWPAWEWGPLGQSRLRYVAFSYAAALTERDNERFRDLVRSREYQELWGDRVRLTGEGKITISNACMGWKLATSIGGVGTGIRGDRVILDDPHNVKEAESEIIRTGTVQWFRETMQNRLNDLAESVIVVIMQRVHEDDVSGVILRHYPEYEHLCIPMEFEPGRRCVTSIWTDPRTKLGDLAWPERFGAKELAGYKQQAYLWSGQYQQSPAPRGGGIIKRDWWVPYLAKDLPLFDYVVASVDTAYTEKQENDPSALTLWGVYEDRKGINRALLIDAWAERLELHALVKKIAQTCKTYKPDHLLIEAKASGHSVAQELRRLYQSETFTPKGRDEDMGQTVIKLVDPKSADKVARVYAISSMFEVGLIGALFVKPAVGDPVPEPSAALVIDQAASFPKAPHDDLVDSCSMALRHLRGRYLRMPSEVEQDEREAMTFKGNAVTRIYPV